jgi:hypothetical protein
MKAGITSTAGLGRKATFTADQGQELAENVLRLAELLSDITPRELRRLACYSAEKLNFRKQTQHGCEKYFCPSKTRANFRAKRQAGRSCSFLGTWKEPHYCAFS